MRRRGFDDRTERTQGSQVGFGSWRPPDGPKRKWTRSTVAVVCGFVVFLALVFTALGLGVKWYNSHSTDSTLPGATPGSRVVDITAGMTASQIGALLQGQGVIANSSDLLDLVTSHGTENKLQPGRYTFTDGLNLADVVRS
jgi:cell division protein YceG involved in septum cleavage